MRGIRFLVDERGHRTAVLIDLTKNAELWEDFYDCMVAAGRGREPRERLDNVRKRLRRHVRGLSGRRADGR